MRRQVIQLEKLDAIGLRWRVPITGKVVAVHVGARQRGPSEFWQVNDRLELHVPGDQAFGVVERG